MADEVKIQITVGGADAAKRELEKVKKSADTNLGGIGKSLKSVGGGITSVGKSLLPLSLAAAGGLGFAAKTAIDFESAFAGVRKTVDASEADFAILEQNLEDLSSKMPVTFVELAKIEELAGQLGVTGVKNLTDFTETMGQMAATTNLTSEDAAVSFARIAGIMNEPIDNVDRMGSSVVELGNTFKTTESEIVNFATLIAGTGNVVGLTTADLFAIGTSFTSVGVQAERGGTAVNRVIRGMSDAVRRGGDELEIFADTADMSAKEFKNAFEEDAALAFSDFVIGLGFQGAAATDTLEELGFADERLIASFLNLSGAGTLVKDTLEDSRNAWEENIALTDEFGKRAETTESQLQILQNNIKLAVKPIGDVLLPVLIELAQKAAPILRDLAEKFGNLDPKTQKIILAVVALVAVAAPLLIIVGSLVTAISGVITVFGVVAAVIVPLTLALVGLAGMFVMVKLSWEQTVDSFETGSEAWTVIIDEQKRQWSALGELIGIWAEDFKEDLKVTKDELEKQFSAMGELIGIWVSDFIQGGKDVVNGIIDGIKSKANEAIATIKDLGGRLWTAFKEKLTIDSPSKLFMEAGQNIVKGLNIGVDTGGLEDNKLLGDRTTNILPQGNTGGRDNTLNEIKMILLQMLKSQKQGVNFNAPVNFAGNQGVAQQKESLINLLIQ